MASAGNIREHVIQIENANACYLSLRVNVCDGVLTPIQLREQVAPSLLSDVPAVVLPTIGSEMERGVRVVAESKGNRQATARWCGYTHTQTHKTRGGIDCLIQHLDVVVARSLNWRCLVAGHVRDLTGCGGDD